MPDIALIEAADSAVERVVAGALRGDEPALATAAPPGAGKTRLVTEIVDAAANAEIHTVVVANNNDQAHQLVARASARSPNAEILFAVSSARLRDVPPELLTLSNVVIPGVRGQPNLQTALGTAQVVICTADKASFLFSTSSRRGAYALETELLVVDEAFQLPWAKFQRTNRRFERLVLVGDPGQLDPFSSVPLPEAWRAARIDHPLDPAPVGWELAGNALVHELLPATFRLPPSAARLVAEAFYPRLDFHPVAEPDDRQLSFEYRAAGSAAAVLDHAAEYGWSFRELDAERTVQADPQVVSQIADIVEVLFTRGARARSEDGESVMDHERGHERVAVGVTHRDQRHAVAAELAARGLGDVPVHTANTIQGLQFDVTIVWHPLSGQTDASSFHVDAGRMCVLLSRHRQACIVVGRAGIGELLDSYPPPEEQLCDGEPNAELTGWEAHDRVWRHLDASRV